VKKFAGTSAVVTGASSGIGRAIAISLAEQGASLHLIGRSEQRLEAAAAEARERDAAVRAVAMDLTEDSAILQLVAALKRDELAVHVLIHSSGLYRGGRIESAPVDELDAQYRVNVRAPYVLTQALLPMLKASKGQIVFINSTQGIEAGHSAGGFAATQHALKALADTLRKEINDEGVRVISVFPGRTATPRTKELFALEGKAFHPELLLQPEDVAEMVNNALLMPRTAEVTDISMRPMLKTY
jgi:short-subunit dehydrogenase